MLQGRDGGWLVPKDLPSHDDFDPMWKTMLEYTGEKVAWCFPLNPDNGSGDFLDGTSTQNCEECSASEVRIKAEQKP